MEKLMRIAFIVNQFPTLSETFILNQITGLIERGHEVDIFADQVGNLDKLHPAVTQHNLMRRTYYLPKVPDNWLWRLLKGGSLFLQHWRQAPAKTLRSLNIFRYGKQAYSLWLLYTLWLDIKQPYDVIHCQFGTQAYRGICFRTINSPTSKLVTIFRGYDVSGFIRCKGKDVYRELFQVGDRFLANCEFFRQRAIQLGCPPEKISVHRSGLDCHKFTFAPRHPDPIGPIRIVTTGRLVEKKGIEYAIRAVAQVAQSYPNLEYRILGDGPLREHLHRLIAELQVESIVHLMGWQNEQEIIATLNRSHLFVAPSVTATDGDQDAPTNVLKEAMAMGLPVISTYHGGIPELVESGVSGYLVPERDVTLLAARLIDLIEQPYRWAAMGQAGRIRVETDYNLHQLNNQLVNFYQELVQPSAQTLLTTTRSYQL